MMLRPRAGGCLQRAYNKAVVGGELGMEVSEHWEGVSMGEICSPGCRLAWG